MAAKPPCDTTMHERPQVAELTTPRGWFRLAASHPVRVSRFRGLRDSLTRDEQRAEAAPPDGASLESHEERKRFLADCSGRRRPGLLRQLREFPRSRRALRVRGQKRLGRGSGRRGEGVG
jgi:hypothetical protein